MEPVIEPLDADGTSYSVRFLVQGKEMLLKLHNVPSSKRSGSELKSMLSSVRLEGDPEIRSLLSGFERLIQQRLKNSENVVLFISEMKEILASIEQVVFRGSSRPASWYRSLYAEIEEVGWENLSSFGEALTSLKFSIKDRNGKAHKLNMSLGKDYPHSAPSIVADVPFCCELRWSNKCRLKDAVHQFHMHLEKFQEFWSILDDIDKTLWVLEPGPSSRAASYRHVDLGNDCTLLVSIDPCNARSLPQCRFFGAASKINSLWQKWKQNNQRWSREGTSLVAAMDMMLHLFIFCPGVCIFLCNHAGNVMLPSVKTWSSFLEQVYLWLLVSWKIILKLIVVFVMPVTCLKIVNWESNVETCLTMCVTTRDVAELSTLYV